MLYHNYGTFKLIIQDDPVSNDNFAYALQIHNARILVHQNRRCHNPNIGMMALKDDSKTNDIPEGNLEKELQE